ncbi:MAG: SMC-Scp complex subunit ScpB [Thermoproteota archaeon]
MISKDSEYKKRIEAALFASGRPLSLEQLRHVAGLRKTEKVERILLELMEEYRNRDTGIEIIEIGKGNYMLRVKTEYTGFVKKVGLKPILSRSALKTLTLIGLKQPVVQSKVVSLRGTHSYRQIRRLMEIGLVETSRSGRSRLLRLTPAGLSVFGVRSDEELKQALIARLPSEPDHEQDRKNSGGVKQDGDRPAGSQGAR